MILQEKKIVDHELFTEIYQQYYKDIFRFIYSYIVNIKDTEDLVQQVFTKLYNHMYLFKNADENVKKWLFKVAMNEAKNNLNSYWKKHKIDCIELEQEPAKEMETDLAFCLKPTSTLSIIDSLSN